MNSKYIDKEGLWEGLKVIVVTFGEDPKKYRNEYTDIWRRNSKKKEVLITTSPED
jgi:hypothetical protein